MLLAVVFDLSKECARILITLALSKPLPMASEGVDPLHPSTTRISHLQVNVHAIKALDKVTLGAVSHFAPAEHWEE